MSKNTITVSLDLTREQIRMLAKFCENEGLHCESKFHELTGTDKESEGDIYFSKAENWYKLENVLKSHLTKKDN